MKRTPENFPQENVPVLISYLKNLERKGIRSIYLDAHVDPGETRSTQTDREPTMAAGYAKESVTQQLAEIEAEVKVCTKCGLHKGRTNSVFGTGAPDTRVLFIGEGPGRDEDLKGEPFVGRSGQLLTKIIQAIDLERKDVYITNIVKCRPPENRNPQEDEVQCCEQYLVRQIDLIKPRVICALGRVAAHWLLDTKASLSSLRQSDNRYRGIQVLVTYHPAALLRNPHLKKDAWEDFKHLRELIN